MPRIFVCAYVGWRENLEKNGGVKLHATAAPGSSFSHWRLEIQRSGVYRNHQTFENMKALKYPFLVWILERQPRSVMLANKEPLLLRISYNRASLNREISWDSYPLHYPFLNFVGYGENLKRLSCSTTKVKWKLNNGILEG